MRTPVQTRHHGSCWARMEVSTKERAEHWLVSWKLFACRIHWHHEEADNDDTELINLCDCAGRALLRRCSWGIDGQQGWSVCTTTVGCSCWFFWVGWLGGVGGDYLLLCENNQDRSSQEFTYRTSEGMANTFWILTTVKARLRYVNSYMYICAKQGVLAKQKKKFLIVSQNDLHTCH